MPRSTSCSIRSPLELANEEHLGVLRQRPEVVGNDLLQPIRSLADALHPGDLLVASMDREVHTLDAVRILVGVVELPDRLDQLVDQWRSLLGDRADPGVVP